MFSIINPVKYPHWDEILLSTEGYSFFHSSSWADVLKETYDYTPFYFSIITNDKILALIPFMEINSFLTGRRGISLPFSDYCEPILNGNISNFDLFLEILKFAKRRGWRYLEFRGGKNLFNSFNLCEQILSGYLIHKIDLKKGLNFLYEKLRDSNRRNIKKATKFGVRVEFSNSWESMNDFLNLNSITRKRHGIPPQPKNFFKIFYEKIILKGKGIIALARYQGKTISSYIFCLFGKNAIYKYGASDLNFQHLRANNLLMWESIKWLYEHGYEELSLGRTEKNNNGLRQFKNGWGGNEDFISYYSYNLKKESFIKHDYELSNWQRWFFSNLPIPILNFVSSILYRHAA